LLETSEWNPERHDTAPEPSLGLIDRHPAQQGIYEFPVSSRAKYSKKTGLSEKPKLYRNGKKLLSAIHSVETQEITRRLGGNSDERNSVTSYLQRVVD
jgi:hypothetical protein